MAETIRVEVELPVEQVEQLLASKAGGEAVRELTDEQLASIMDRIRGGAALDEPEAAIIGKLISKVSSKLSSKQVQRVVTDVVTTTVIDTVATGAAAPGAESQSPKR